MLLMQFNCKKLITLSLINEREEIMFNKNQHSTAQSNNNENATSSAYPKDSDKTNASKSGCGCGCKSAAPVDEEVVEIEEERFDY